MRCLHCDLPLSPARTSCPRCGTPNGAKSTNTPLFPVSNFHKAFHTPSSSAEPGPFSSLPQQYKQSNRSPGIGFSLSGLCLVTASLILIFVYFMAQNLPLPSNSLSSQLTATGQPDLPTASARHTSPAQPNTVTPSSTSSSIVTYPGRQYIDEAHMTTAIDANAQPLQVETTFKVNQTMYVTFEVHPNGHVGAVCLLWYLNARQFTNYPFAINTTVSSPAYSYATADSPGSGYVELYWETTPSCTNPNKILATRVAFAVTA